MLQAKRTKNKTNNKNNIFFVIKTIVFTIVLFSAISILTTNNAQDIASSQITNISQHKAATTNEQTYKKKFQVMCVNNIITCIRIDFDGNYNYKEKYFYLASILYVSKFIDKNSNTNNNFSKTIKEITLKSNGSGRRWYATKNHIEINTDLIDSYTEFIEILTHEIWHVVDLGMIEGKNYKKDTKYTEFGKAHFAIDDPSLTYYKISFKNETSRRPRANKEEFCSRYGMTDPFEDFAECFNLYINHHNLFKYMANDNIQLQKKYDFINNILNQNYLKNDILNNNSNLRKIIDNPDRRTRDTTKL